MKTEQVINEVYINLTILAKRTKGQEHEIASEVMHDLDRLGLRKLLAEYQRRGRLISRQQRELRAKQGRIVALTRRSDGFERALLALGSRFKVTPQEVADAG